MQQWYHFKCWCTRDVHLRYIACTSRDAVVHRGFVWYHRRTFVLPRLRFRCTLRCTSGIYIMRYHVLYINVTFVVPLAVRVLYIFSANMAMHDVHHHAMLWYLSGYSWRALNVLILYLLRHNYVHPDVPQACTSRCTIAVHASRFCCTICGTFQVPFSCLSYVSIIFPWRSTTTHLCALCGAFETLLQRCSRVFLMVQARYKKNAVHARHSRHTYSGSSSFASAASFR